jgi:hypothetical protein
VIYSIMDINDPVGPNAILQRRCMRTGSSSDDCLHPEPFAAFAVIW